MTDSNDRTQLRKIGDGCYDIDVRGYACPYPQVLVMGALSELAPGDLLEVTLDNPPSARDVPKALKRKGHEVKEILKVDKLTWKISIKKKP